MSVLNLSRMQIYRLFRGGPFWICVIGVTVFLSIICASIFAASEQGFAHGYDPGRTSLEVWGGMFVLSPLYPFALGFFMAVFTYGDFKNGAIKNHLQALGGRSSYICSLVVVLVVVAVLLLVEFIVVTEVALTILGESTSYRPSAFDALLWCGQVLCVGVAYGAMVSVLSMLFESAVVGVIACTALCTGLIENLVGVALSNMAFLPDYVQGVMNGYLFADLRMLGMGLLNEASVYMETGITIVIVVAIGLLVMRLKDVG